jgi:phosphatidylglycerol---prolipoprotein diacylglyceryl transferase
MIPYVRAPDLTLIPAHFLGGSWPLEDIAVHPFGLLVAIAIWVGIALTFQQSRRNRLQTAAVQSYLIWVLVSGFVGGHVFDLLFYYRQYVVSPGTWFRLSEGQSSFGGFLGAALGSWAWSIRYRTSAWAFAEAVSSAFPSAWFFGRLGCALAHDHPGRVSSVWWAVAYPGQPRLDMGLLEAAMTLPLAAAFLWLRKRSRPKGFFVGVMCVYYAPIRFALDFARASDIAGADARYARLTPAQWGCVGLLVIGTIALAGAFARAQRQAQA